jgi:hypothetical protein
MCIVTACAKEFLLPLLSVQLCCMGTDTDQAVYRLNMFDIHRD